jgi:hypothetical protein
MMLRLLFFVPCERVILEQGTNALSLISLLQRMQVFSQTVAADAKASQIWYAVAQWQLNDVADLNAHFQQRVTLITPSGAQAIEVFTDFEMTKDLHRTLIRFPAFPIGEAGPHDLRLELRKKGDEAWTEVASYPLAVEHGQPIP